MASGMTFLDMQTELSDRLGAYDNTVAADLVKIKRWLNMAQREISGRSNWPFLVGHEIIQTVPDITTGTVSINIGSTSLTFSSAPTNSVTDYFIRFSTDTNWYKIESHTASSTSATITPAYGGSSNLSGEPYRLRKIFYSTSTPFESILDIKNTNDGRIVTSANSRETDVLLPLYWDQGAIYQYINSVPDSNGNMRFSLLYSPSLVENLQVRGLLTLTDMVNDSDQSFIQGRWSNIIIDMASFYGFSSIDDTRSASFDTKAENGIEAMRRVYNPDLGRHRVTRSLTESVSDGPNAILPPQYGVIES